MACLDHGDARRQGQPFMMLEFPRHRGVRAAFFQEGEQKISTRAAADRDTFDRAGPRPQPDGCAETLADKSGKIPWGPGLRRAPDPADAVGRGLYIVQLQANGEKVADPAGRPVEIGMDTDRGDPRPGQTVGDTPCV